MFKISKIFSTLSPTYINLTTLLHGKKIGTDAHGNRYYISRKNNPSGRKRRWVLYKDDIEASTIPPEWHAWMHYQSDNIPNDTTENQWQETRQTFITENKPNKTGSIDAYRPKGYSLTNTPRASATGDYESWRPDSEV